MPTTFTVNLDDLVAKFRDLADSPNVDPHLTADDRAALVWQTFRAGPTSGTLTLRRTCSDADCAALDHLAAA
jgi:hypothetical protein